MLESAGMPPLCGPYHTLEQSVGKTGGPRALGGGEHDENLGRAVEGLSGFSIDERDSDVSPLGPRGGD